MPVYTFSNREFTRDMSVAKRAAADGPVNFGDATLLNVMGGIPGGGSIEFDPPRLDVDVRTAEFD